MEETLQHLNALEASDLVSRCSERLTDIVQRHNLSARCNQFTGSHE